MAFDALRSTLRRPDRDAGRTAIPASVAMSASPAVTFGSAADQYAPVFADPVAGGGTDAQAFNCPSCGRTLTRGARRCDGLRAAADPRRPDAPRGDPLRGRRPRRDPRHGAARQPVRTARRPAAPADPATTGQGTGLAPVALDIPSGAMAAIRGTTAINGRLAAEAGPLAKALDGKPFNTSSVVKVLRRMAIDTRAGAGMLRAMAVWPEAAGQQAALQAFYEDLGRRIDNGLAASVNSSGSYKRAAKGIVAALKDVPGLDADARALAALGGSSCRRSRCRRRSARSGGRFAGRSPTRRLLARGVAGQLHVGLPAEGRPGAPWR